MSKNRKTNKSQKNSINVHVVKAAEKPIQKAENSTQLSEQGNSADILEWIPHPMPLEGYKVLVSHSSVLPQCIQAYKNNIAGFGIDVRYKEDMEETAEMAAEFDKMKEVIDLLSMDMDPKEVFENIIGARETYGIGYTEVIRNALGEVVELVFIRNTPSIQKTKPLGDYVDVKYFYKGHEVERKKCFCKFRQTINSKMIYFKEFGDPRDMNKNTGNYVKEGESISDADLANEILEFPIGTEPYGEVRWIGQILNVAGSRQAEELNKNYFDNGRHTPLMFLLKGGTLTEESYHRLQHYMDDIKGEAGQHSFLILEVEDNDSKTEISADEKPDIEVKDLASILQKDELFQDYLDNGRKKAQSAFRLPDLYVGYTDDFNRATAQTAMEVTEKQVFQPERHSLAWIINNKLLNGYGFRYVEAYFKEPDITNPEDLYKILSVCNMAGGVTPNKAKEIAYKTMGETAENYPEEWGDVPLQYIKSVPQTNNSLQPGAIDNLSMQLMSQIQKAQSHNDDAVVAVMKEVRSLLLKMQEEAS